MIHLRIDNEPENARRKMACGIGPELPEGDKLIFEAEYGLHHMVDCPGCKPSCRPLGTPLSQLSGRSGELGHTEFCQIAHSWGMNERHPKTPPSSRYL
jgi:hypothetical protein